MRSLLLGFAFLAAPASAATTVYQTVTFNGGRFQSAPPITLTPTYIEKGVGFAQFGFDNITARETPDAVVEDGVIKILAGNGLFWQVTPRFQIGDFFAQVGRLGKVSLYSFDVLTEGKITYAGPTVADYFTPQANVWTTLFPTPAFRWGVQAGAINAELSPAEVDNMVFAIVVPEPATWAMLISGFGVVGGALRVRRRRAPLPA